MHDTVQTGHPSGWHNHPITTVWSTKGGVGVSTVSALLAVACAARAEPARLLDLCGDLPALLGIAEPGGPGAAEWSSTPGRRPEALDRIDHRVASDLTLIARGRGPFGTDAAPLLSALAAASSQAHQIVDCGRLGDDEGFEAQIAAGASRRLLVVRRCYVTLCRARRLPVAPTGVIVVSEPRRALSRADVESIIEAPVVAEIAVDVDIARAIDAGIIARRAPRRLLQVLGGVMGATSSSTTLVARRS